MKCIFLTLLLSLILLTGCSHGETKKRLPASSHDVDSIADHVLDAFKELTDVPVGLNTCIQNAMIRSPEILLKNRLNAKISCANLSKEEMSLFLGSKSCVTVIDLIDFVSQKCVRE